jgi:Flp pilus assembly pilin Flp
MLPPQGGAFFSRKRFGQSELSKLFRDRCNVTSIEYALPSGSIALVLFEVMQVPAEALCTLMVQLTEA